MRTTNLLSVVRETWNNFAADRPISSVVDVSVNVSTNHVYRMDLKSDDHLFAKISYFGTYQHFREDHSIIQALSQVLPDPYEGFLAHSYRQDGVVHTARHALLGQDVWVVFYRPVAIGERLPRKLETQHITSLGRELARFHRACSDAMPQLPGFSKTMRYDIADLLTELDTEAGQLDYGEHSEFIRSHCNIYLAGLDAGNEDLPSIPVFVDWNIGNFSLDRDGRFFSRWDYDWFRVASRVMDFFFFSRVVSSVGDQTVFSYVIDTFLEDRFLAFLRAYHAEYPLTEAEIRFLPEAYRFFILNYVVKYGQHFFHNIYGNRLQQEAYATYLPQVDRIDVEPLLKALSL